MISLLIVFILLFLFTACSDQSDDDHPKTPGLDVTNEVSSFNDTYDENTLGFDYFTKYYESVLSFNYGQHFSLFQEEFVKESFITEALECGYGYEEALERIKEVSSKAFKFKNVEISFDIVSQYDSTDDFRPGKDISSSYISSFKRCGLDAGKVSKAITYKIGNLCVLINDRFSADRVDGDILDFIVYQYEEKWYVYPTLMEDDMSIDMLGKNVDYLIGENESYGYVTEVGEYYIILDDVAFLTDTKVDVSVGDYLHIIYFETGGMRLYSPPNFDNKWDSIEVYSIKSISITQPHIG
jgi:hypothetical protein